MSMSFLREVFSEDNNHGSASRVMMLVHALAGIGFVCHHLSHGHLISEIPWPGVTGFVTAPYALNQLRAGAAAIAGVFAKP